MVYLHSPVPTHIQIQINVPTDSPEGDRHTEQELRRNGVGIDPYKIRTWNGNGIRIM